MKKKNIMLGLGIVAAAAITIPSIAEATIYLMKGEKIVATYPDDAVDYVTFDEPKDPDMPDKYDVDNRSYFLNSNYYGDTQAASGYNYSVQFVDLPFDDRGMPPADAIYFSFNLKGPEAADRKNPFIPEGTYRLAEVGGGEFTILANDGAAVIDHYVKYIFKSAWLKVSKNADKWKYEFTGVTQEGKSYHSVYDGVPNAYDQSIDWLDSDQYIQGGTVRGAYLDEKRGGGPTGNGANLAIYIAEKGYDQDGWLVKPCNYLTLIGNVEMDERGNVLPGKWTVTEEEVATPNTLLAGKCINFLGMAMPSNSNLQHWTGEKDASVGLIKSGTMTVTNGKFGMAFTYDFTTDKGKKVSGVFQGQIMVENHPYAESLNLESDYTLDLKDKIGVCRTGSWRDDIQVEVYKFDSNVQYMGDRVDLSLVPNDGVTELKPGIYKVKPDAQSVGKINVGDFVPQTGVGTKSVFVKYTTDPAGTVLKATGIKGGQVEVIKNADGTWTLNYDLLDGQDTPKHIRGTWTGNFQ